MLNPKKMEVPTYTMSIIRDGIKTGTNGSASQGRLNENALTSFDKVTINPYNACHSIALGLAKITNIFLCNRICKINSESLDKKEKLLTSHLSDVKDKKKKDKTRQSSSGGSAPGTPVPGERGSSSIGTPLTPGELKVHFIIFYPNDCS